jgi:glucoamylase
MPRDIPVANGSVLVSFDRNAMMRELHFPYIGQENHTSGEPFHLGVWVNGEFSWLPNGWKLEREYLGDTLVTKVVFSNDTLRIEVNDLVDFEENVYLKKISVANLTGNEKEVRIFLAHDFHIYGNDIGDTAAFRPENRTLLHYKGERYFLINILANHKYGIDFFATGNEGGNFEGTWKDAEDGVLSGNPCAQGRVDSVIGMPLTLPPRGMDTGYYWIAVGKNWEEVKLLNEIVIKKTPEEILRRTADYWTYWSDKEKLNDSLLPAKVARLYKRSLLILTTFISGNGSLIAGADTDVIHFNRDTYNYMWPRDGAFVAYGLDLAGYDPRAFYQFCSQILTSDGYFLHKYTPSGALGSSWHPWEKEKKAQLPIQEDETALVIWALWNHYEQHRDIYFIRKLYNPLIRKAADFMMEYRHSSGLPIPSYDLWEERQGILTFTASTVYGGLMAAASFAEMFGEKSLAEEYREGARAMRQAMEKYLYLPREKRFARMINFQKDGSIQVDTTLDASLYALFAFGVYSPDDEKVTQTMNQVFEKLAIDGGIGRYENDLFYSLDGKTRNSWFVTTLWKAQYQIALAKTLPQLESSLQTLEWVADRALPSGVLAEQIDPRTNEPLSVSPLAWSHGTFIATVQQYLNKLIQFEQCPTCQKSKLSKFR